MPNIRYLDIDELNERLAELEAIKQALSDANDALDDYDAEHNPPEDDDDERQDLIEAVEAAQEEFNGISDELGSLETLRDEIGERRGKISDEGGPFIHENDFEDYARELAEDIGAIDPNAGWPLGCIDWDKAADELKMDYTSVDWEGVTYYYRA